MNLADDRVYRFGDMVLDPRERRLSRAGVEIALTPKAFDLLQLLIEQRGHLLTKDLLMETVWPDRIVAESNLAKHVWMLRQALGEEDADRFIQTVPKLGYRFVAPVTETCGDSAPPAVSPPAASRSTPAHSATWRRWALGGVTLAAVASAGFYVSRPSGARARGGAVVAVIDPANLSADPSAAWIGPALSETLGAETVGDRKFQLPASELLQPAERGLPRPSAGGYGAATLSRLRNQLDADYVLSGSYLTYMKGDAVQVRLDLTVQDARSGRVLGNPSRSGPIDDLPSIAALAGADLRRVLNGGTPADATATALPPPSADVMRQIGIGLAAMRRYDALQAKGAFLEAIAEAPQYAPAYAYLSQAWKMLGYDAKARVAIEQAVRYDAKLPEADRRDLDAQLAAARFDWAGAVAALRRLQQLSPGDHRITLRLIGALISAGKLDEATALAGRLDPDADSDPGVEAMRTRLAAAREDGPGRVAHARKALAVARQRDAEGVIAEAEVQLGIAQTGRDDREAGQALREAFAAYGRLGNPGGQATALESLANMLAPTDPAAARAADQQALALYQSIGNDDGTADCYANIATMLWAAGNPDGARTALDHVIALRRKTEDVGGQAWATAAQAVLASDDDAGDAVVDLFRQAIVLDRQAGIKGHLGFSLFSLSEVLRVRGDIDGAAATCREAQAAYAATNDPVNVANADLECALIALDGGHVRNAAALAQRARAAAMPRSDEMTIGNADLTFAQILQAAGHNASAAGLFVAAGAAYEKGTMATGQAIALSLAALADDEAGNMRDRDAHLARARALRAGIAQHLEVIAADIALAELDGRMGRRGPAIANLQGIADDADKRRWSSWAFEARLAACRLAQGADRAACRDALSAQARASGNWWGAVRALEV